MQIQNKKVLITGCGGMLGNAIYPYFKERTSELLPIDIVIEEHEKDWLQYLDIREPDQLKQAFKDFQPDLVLHLAALVEVEGCEDDPVDAENTNVTATKNIAELCKQNDITMVYISTGGLFDGKKDDFYTEDDQPNPTSVYAQTKYDGELVVADILEKYYTVRAGWMTGGGPDIDHKFTKLIMAQIKEGKKILHACTDKIGTPTYTHDFAMNLFALLDTDQYGLYHMVGKESGSRFDVAKELVDIAGYTGEIEVVGVTGDYFEKDFPVERPDNERLFNAKLEALGINIMRPWRIAIREYIQKDYADYCKG